MVSEANESGSEQPSGRAARAARPWIVRRSRHGYPDSLLGRDRAQHRLGIAEPGGGAERHGGVDRRQVLGRERDGERAHVLLEVRPPLRSRDGDDVLALGEHPGERELRGPAALARRERLEVAHQVEVFLEVLALEARREAAVVVGREVLEALDLPGQEAAPERAVGDEADPQLAARREDPVLRVAAPERVFGLQRGDGVHRARAPERLGPRFREAEPAHLPRAHQVGHRAHRVLDRRVRIHAVLVVEVDRLEAEALQAPVARGAHVLRAPVDGAHPRVVAAHDAELGGDDDLLAPAAEGAPDQLLVGVRAVHVGGVEEGDAEVERAVDGGDRLVVVARAVELRHPHAAEADGGDGGTEAPELSSRDRHAAIIECGASPGKAAIAAHAMARARKLSHVDRRGRARMVDVSPKPITRREAVARGEVRMRSATLAQIAAGALPKGDALAVARLAGIMAAKRTADLVPLCHPLPLAHVDVELVPDPEGSRVLIESRVAVAAPTGVEMEALTAVAVAGLTLYDMCKAVDREMTLGAIRLVRKTGGRSGTFVRRGERA